MQRFARVTSLIGPRVGQPTKEIEIDVDPALDLIPKCKNVNVDVRVMAIEEGDSCPICLEELPDRGRAVPDGCSHVFCYECMYEWTAVHNRKTCPMCRQSIRALRPPDRDPPSFAGGGPVGSAEEQESKIWQVIKVLAIGIVAIGAFVILRR